jgi:beta-N-acetylhexosaminidase
VAAIMPQPKDLTPADTSSNIQPALAAALRTYHPHVDEFITDHPPTDADIAALREKAAGYDLFVIGTLNATMDNQQAALVQALMATDLPTVTVALRIPYDLAAYPEAQTYACTYSIQPASLQALAAALFGDIPFEGQLPVRLDL